MDNKVENNIITDNIIIEELKKKLLEEKAETEKQINKLKENNSSGSLLEWTGELSSYDNHPADIGTESFEREKLIRLNFNQQKLLDDINDAIKKIEKGSYGFCESCSKRIDYERLKVIPYARECINCAKEHQTKNKDFPKRYPVDEDILGYSFHDGFINEETNNSDGLNIVRQLEAYGSADNMQDMGGDIKDYDDINNIYDTSIESVEGVDLLSNKDRKNSLY